ncbi:type IV secretory system conjugative DNA transfer family protein [Parabacteroides merdae]|uniref:type IV secretory system conjugative DNA transfer family protein n=1 Tax=Parabacteroides merdae TaxID=46503 RepID=UPI0034A179D8
MDETREQQNYYSFMQAFVYFLLLFEIIVFCDLPPMGWFDTILAKVKAIPIYHNIFYSKLFILFMLILVSIGTRPQKQVEFNPYTQVALPLGIGALFFFSSALIIALRPVTATAWYNWTSILFIVTSFVGTMLLNVGLDNISKQIRVSMLRDRWNNDNESFEQTSFLNENDFSVNIPMEYYYKKKWNRGWMNIVNPFRGTLLIGTPGSGKSFSVVNSYIRQHSAKGFAMMIYDFKFPDLANIAFYNFLMNKKKGLIPEIFEFNVVNFNDIEYSRRINPLRPEYLRTLADAIETATAVVESLKKGGNESGGGSDQFFSQSAINFLASCLFYFSKYGPKDENGKRHYGAWSDLPHVLAFMNRSYAEIFEALFKEKELESLLSPFRSAYDNKAFDQLEGQIGTLKISISRLATKESYWVFSGDDFSLYITNPDAPSYLVIANSPATQDINSALNALVLNRLVRLVNTKHNLPCSIIIDEMPTIYFHKIDNLIATARSNKVSVLMGIQEKPQLVQLYGKTGADVIFSVVGNVISGSARAKETLDWLQNFFGKVKQVKEGVSIADNKTTISINENMDFVIPGSKIANLPTGSLVAQLAMDFTEDEDFPRCMYNCRTKMDLKMIKDEEDHHVKIPKYYSFNSIEEREAFLSANYSKIVQDIETLINEESPKAVAEVVKKQNSGN